MKTFIRFVLNNFAVQFACAGALVYSLLIAVINYDKPMSEIALLVIRQAMLTFPVTGLLVPRVRIIAVTTTGFPLYIQGVMVPALWVTLVSTLAHWYFTNELRNVSAPFFLSAVLNTFLVTAYRAGYMTFWSQARFVLRGFR